MTDLFRFSMNLWHVKIESMISNAKAFGEFIQTRGF